MVLSSLDIYFKSGEATHLHYDEDSNISYLELTNSDDAYYQTGTISLFDVPSSQIVGDKILIKINGIHQFKGYVCRRQRSIEAGRQIYTYQLVGETYDLWRYRTDSTASYSGMSGYIVSTMVSTFCTGISSNITSPYPGTNLTEKIDLTNKLVGDAIKELNNLDGYKFYISTNNVLQYYHPGDSQIAFTIVDSDFFELPPVEDADEDIVNDILVIGGTDYSIKDIVSPSFPSSNVFPSGIMVAQQFKAQDPRLSALRFYLNRSTDPNQPDALDFEIWEGSSTDVFQDGFNNYTYLDEDTNTGVKVEQNDITDDWELIQEYNETQIAFGDSDGYKSAYKYNAQTFKVNEDCCPHSCRFSQHHLGKSGKYWMEIRPTGSNGHPDGNTTGLVSGSHTHSTPGQKNTIYYFNNQVKLTSGTTYALVHFHNVDATTTVYGSTDDSYSDGKWFYGSDGTSWTQSSVDVAGWLKERVYSSNSHIETTVFTNDTQYMKLNLNTVTSSSRVYLSGTNSGSKNWNSITNNTWYNFTFAYNSGIRVMYCLSSTGYWTPRISLATLSVGDAYGSSQGIPNSGTKLEWSDDISFSATDIPYAPSYSSWKSYSDPKLRVEEDRYYWMVFSHNSSNSEYWQFYYDPNSGYTDGRIAMSWDNGVNWSSNNTDPTHVPEGSMTFDIGWKQGSITATATNQDSIDTYGRHTTIINDSSINTLEAAQARANYEVSGSSTIPLKGSITIDGRTDLDVDNKITISSQYMGISEDVDIVSYTQRLDNQGFVSIIQYGRHSFDITKKVADLEREVYG